MENTAAELYKKAMNLAASGQYAPACSNMHEYLALRPSDAAGWYNIAAIYMRRAQFKKAGECFHKAHESGFDSKKVFQAMINCHLAEGDTNSISDVVRYFISCGSVDRQFLLEIISEFRQKGDYYGAIELLTAADNIWIDNRFIRETIAEIRAGRPKLAFLCGGDGDTFLKDILPFLEKRFEIRHFTGNTVEQVYNLMQWCDIAWFEWCSELAEIGSGIRGVCKKIVRLHRYEAYLDWPVKINWNNIDTLMTVGNPCVHEVLFAQVPDLRSKTRLITIPNGVDLEKITFRARNKGANLAFVGNLRMVKNPMMLLQVFKHLHDQNPHYRLHIAGKVQDMVVGQYYRHMVSRLELQNSVFFDGWQSDIQKWLADKHYIISTSVIESQGLGILEAMAGGIKPVIHNFPGAQNTFGEKYLFNTPAEFCQKITENCYDSAEYRNFVQQNYSLDSQLKSINSLLKGLEIQITGGKTVCNV